MLRIWQIAIAALFTAASVSGQSAPLNDDAALPDISSTPETAEQESRAAPNVAPAGEDVLPTDREPSAVNGQAADESPLADPAVAARASIPAVQEPPSPSQLRVIRLKHARASTVVEIIEQLYRRSSASPAAAADVARNSIAIQGDPELLDEVRTLIAALDIPGDQSEGHADEATAHTGTARSSGELGGSTFLGGQQSIAALQQEYEAKEQSVRILAARLRDSGNGGPSDLDRRALTEAVRRAFLTRQTLQRARIRQFRARISRLQEAVDTRDRIAEQIVARRVEELLQSEPPEQGIPESSPGSSPLQNSSGGVAVSFLLDAETYPASLLQRNLDNPRLSLHGSGIQGVMNGREYANLVAVLAHRCRLISITPVDRSGHRYWSAKLFVPQGPHEDGSNQSLTQASLDAMAANDVEFHLKGLTGEEAGPPLITDSPENATPLDGSVVSEAGAVPVRLLIAGQSRGTIEWIDGSGSVTHTSEASTFASTTGSKLRFRWSHLPQHPELALFVNVTLHPVASGKTAARAMMTGSAIPLVIPDTLIDAAASGDLATWILYWPNDAPGTSVDQLAATHATTLVQAVHALDEALAAGTPICSIHLSQADLPDVTLRPSGSWPDLEGDWKLVGFSSEGGATRLPHLSGRSGAAFDQPMKIRGNVMVRPFPDGTTRESRLELISESDPRQMLNLRIRNGRQYRNRYLVSVADDTLRLATSMNGSSQFPESLNSPRTIVQTYQRLPGDVSGTLTTPEETLERLTRSGRDNDFRTFVSLLTDEEAERMAGMFLLSAASMATVQSLVATAAGDADVPVDASAARVAEIVRRHKRDDADLDAVSAHQVVHLQGAAVVMQQLPGATMPVKPSLETPSSADELSDVLRTASGVLNDPREFCVAMLEAMKQMTPDEQHDDEPSWHVEQTKDHAVAIDVRPNPAEETSAVMTGPTEMELQRVNGRWLISSLMSDRQLMMVFAGPPQGSPVPEPGARTQPPIPD